MAKFRIETTETVHRYYEVEARHVDDAIDKVYSDDAKPYRESRFEEEVCSSRRLEPGLVARGCANDTA